MGCCSGDGRSLGLCFRGDLSLVDPDLAAASALALTCLSCWTCLRICFVSALELRERTVEPESLLIHSNDSGIAWSRRCHTCCQPAKCDGDNYAIRCDFDLGFLCELLFQDVGQSRHYCHCDNAAISGFEVIFDLLRPTVRKVQAIANGSSVETWGGYVYRDIGRRMGRFKFATKAHGFDLAWSHSRALWCREPY
jgi:hypothetical protein